MQGKKGFTFVEVLVIVVLIAIISLVAVPSYKKGLETSKNNQARAKLVEVANAAKMFNEDARGADQIAGSFGAPLAGYRNPEDLFFWTPSAMEKDDAGKYAYLKNPESFSGKGFRGYDFYICPPDKVVAGAHAKCNSINVIAVMTPSDTIKDERYVGKVWVVSNDNPGKVSMESATAS